MKVMGEAEVIAIVIETKADLLLLDNKKARMPATRLGLRILGTLDVLILAKKKNSWITSKKRYQSS